MSKEAALNLPNVLEALRKVPIAERRKEEFYATAQFLQDGDFTIEDIRKLGRELMTMIERDHWFESNGAFNDE